MGWTRLDYVVKKVLVGGVDVTDQCTELSIRLGFDLRISEATVSLVALGAGATHWDTVEIWAGIHSPANDTASDIAGEAQGIKRFSGYLIDFDYSDYPETIRLECKGPLCLAERIKVTEDAEAIHRKDIDPLATTSKYSAPGIDLSANPDTFADWRDADMVTWVLTECGLAGRLGTIGGTGHILGTVGFDQFVWNRDQSGLSFIEDLDTVCLGFRTFEVLGSTIVRAKTGPRAPFEYTAFTLAEASTAGFDGSPASMTRNADEVRNRAVVSGYDGGFGAEVAVVLSGVLPSLLPPGIGRETIALSSGMIEFAFTDGASGDGLSCDEVGNWLLDDRADAMLDATVPTWRDDPFSPGQVVYLNAPHMEVNQSMWLRRVDITVNATSFTQVLQLHDRAQRDRDGTLMSFGVSLGSSSLPLGLG